MKLVRGGVVTAPITVSIIVVAIAFSSFCFLERVRALSPVRCKLATLTLSRAVMRRVAAHATAAAPAPVAVAVAVGIAVGAAAAAVIVAFRVFYQNSIYYSLSHTHTESCSCRPFCTLHLLQPTVAEPQ